MDGYVRKSAITDLLEKHADSARDQRKYVYLNRIQGIIDEVNKIPPISREQAQAMWPECHMVKHLEPFMLNSIIGRDVWRCEHCNERVGRHDKYCHGCGWQITGEIEREKRHEHP